MSEEDTLVSTDDAILDSIGEGDEQVTTTDDGEQDTGEATDSPEEAPAVSSGQGTDGGDGTEQQRQAGGPQDLVGRDGKVIAAAGRERRFYETGLREKNRADQAAAKAAELTVQLEAVNKAGSVGTQYNLSPDEVTTGAQLVAAYKNNPVETIQYMLTQAQTNGHNVDAIVSGGTDMSAVKSMLDNALAPLVADRQAKIDTQENNDRALGIYNQFSAQHPDAAIHEGSLARLLQQEPSLSPEAAYYKLQSYYLQKGWDWTKNLEQLQQEAQAGPSSVNTQPQPPDGGVALRNVTDTPRVADVSTSTDDIIRQAMAEAGIN